MNSVLPFEVLRFGDSSKGPRLLIIAGVHGDEFLPMLAVRELIRQFKSDPDQAGRLQGELTLIPVVNRSAFQRGQRCGADGKDLARTCPGRKEGTQTEQLAWALAQEIHRADFLIDLHTGGRELCVLPLAGYMLHPEESIRNQQREMAQAFQLPFVWGTTPELPGRSLSVARDQAVPAIYVEYLGAHRELTEIARLSKQGTPGMAGHPLVEGCWNVMRSLRIWDQPARNDITPEIVEDNRQGSGHMQVSHPAPATGFLDWRVPLGEQLTAGTLLARIVSETGQTCSSVLAEQTGRLVAMRDYPRVTQGDAVAVIAEKSDRT